MRSLFVAAGFLLASALLCGNAYGGNEVGASFVKQEGGEHLVTMQGNLTENNLSCQDAQPCQDLFETVHDAAQNSFSGTFVGELVDAKTLETRTAEFAVGTLHLGGQVHRIIFEIAGQSIGVIWVDPAAKIDPENPVPTDTM